MKSIIKKKPSTDEQNINKYDAMIQDLSADDLSLVTGGVDLTDQIGGKAGAAGKAGKVSKKVIK